MDEKAQGQITNWSLNNDQRTTLALHLTFKVGQTVELYDLAMGEDEMVDFITDLVDGTLEVLKWFLGGHTTESIEQDMVQIHPNYFRHLRELERVAIERGETTPTAWENRK